MLIYNIDQMDDQTNGAGGTIIGVEYKGNDINCIIVKFDNDSWGAAQRERYQHSQFMTKYKAQNGTPIFRYKLEYQLAKTSGWKNAAKAKLLQFPLRINYAQTSNKMQVRILKF